MAAGARGGRSRDLELGNAIGRLNDLSKALQTDDGPSSGCWISVTRDFRTRTLINSTDGALICISSGVVEFSLRIDYMSRQRNRSARSN